MLDAERCVADFRTFPRAPIVVTLVQRQRSFLPYIFLVMFLPFVNYARSPAGLSAVRLFSLDKTFSMRRGGYLVNIRRIFLLRMLR